jgi:acyl carrier protein
MTDAERLALIRDVLAGIAPEAADAEVPGDADLRETLDLDSMDFMNFVIGLHERTGVDIPEADYPQLFTLDGAMAYLAAKGP